LINFTVTPEGLEDQLLVEVVRSERPELEQQKDQLILQLSDFKRQLKELEDKILKLVAEASDDILNDEELI
jgi:dynein heavy chain